MMKHYFLLFFWISIHWVALGQTSNEVDALKKRIHNLPKGKEKTSKQLELIDLLIEDRGFDEAKTLIESIQKEAEKQKDEQTHTQASVLLARILLIKKDLKQCEAICRKAIPILEKYKDDWYLSRAWDEIAHLYVYDSDFSQAIQGYNIALKHAKKSKNYIIEARILDYFGTIYSTAGELDKTLEYLFNSSWKF
jgi:ATP/maltotriose-dependent transcriptional regulator MalT